MSSKQNTAPPVPRSVTATDWDRVAANPEFKSLLTAKAKFVVPATIFFMVYYLALPVLVGYAPDLMKTPVIGPLNLAYLFALSQFFMAWIVAFLYMRAASTFDKQAATVLTHLTNSNTGGAI